MALTDIKKRHVLKAMAECRKVGESAFLDKYGFKESRGYLLLHGGRTYPSKAVVGVAHGFAVKRPWRPNDFSGGEKTVARFLRNLGLKVQLQGFDDWKLLNTVPRQAVALREYMTPWTSWSSRQGLKEIAWPGIYLIGVFSKRPANVLPLPKQVVYVGQSSRPLRHRLDEFEMSVRGKPGHSGGWAYRERVAQNLNSGFVSVLPVRQPAAVRDMAIGLLERILIWEYTVRWRCSPRCNSK